MKIMIKKWFINTTVIALPAILLSQAVLADATVTYEQLNGAQKTTNTMKIKNSKIRFTPPTQTNNYSIYDSQSGSLTHVDTSQKHYLSMDEKAIAEQAQKAREQKEQMRKAMEAKMEDMPPDQREQVEKMMNNHLARVDKTQPAPKLDQKKTGRTETIAGIECTVYESFFNGVKVSEICIAEPDKMGLDAADAQTLTNMQSFMKQMQKMAQQMMNTNTPVSEINGIPLHTKLYAPDGSIKLETRLSSINTDKLSDDTVSIPAGYSQIQMNQMPGM